MQGRHRLVVVTAQIATCTAYRMQQQYAKLPLLANEGPERGVASTDLSSGEDSLHMTADDQNQRSGDKTG